VIGKEYSVTGGKRYSILLFLDIFGIGAASPGRLSGDCQRRFAVDGDVILGVFG
jgi:hypothetical protein